MTILLPIFIFVVWLFWIPVCVLERAARGDFGGTSILPGIPIFPLLAWGLAALLDRVHDQLGLVIVGGVHVLMLLGLIVSAVRSLYVIRSAMHDIKTKYKRIRQAVKQLDGVEFFSSEHKKTREWYILGAVCQQLLTAGLDAPTTAVEGEAPDFFTYRADGSEWAPIEIVEALRPDYRRHAFFKQDALPDAPMVHDMSRPLKHPWESLRNQVKSKARKNYPAGTCLVVYFNIGRRFFPDCSTPFHDRLLAEHAKLPFDGLGSFGRVLIMNVDMKSLVQLHPTAATIVPDENN